MAYSMICKAHIDTTTTATELLTAIATEVKNCYDSFISRLTTDGHIEFYNDQNDFAKRIMFFDAKGNTLRLREKVRDWLFYGKDYYNNHLKQNTITILTETKDLESIKKRVNDLSKALIGYGNDAYLVKEMDKIIQSVLMENPILSDSTISIKLRNTILVKAIQKNSYYKACERELMNYVKYAISSMVTYSIDNHSYSPYNGIVAIMKGL